MKQTLSRLASNGNRAKEKNGHWKGGRYIDKQGYVHIRANGKDRKEHTNILEQEMGRRLQKGEVVHHINGNRQDNRRENLELLTISEHMKHHHPHGIIKHLVRCQCMICHQEFLGKPHQKLCSPACHRLRQLQHFKSYHAKTTRRRTPILIKCDFCGIEMLRTTRKNVRFYKCKSLACGVAYNRLLRQEKTAAKRAANS
jgi:hypothetical protein